MKIAVLSFYQGIASRGVERFVEELTQRTGDKYHIRVYAGQKVNLSKKPCHFLRRFYLDYYSLQIALFTLKTLKKFWGNPPNVLMPTNNGWQSIFSKIYCLLTGIKLILAGHSGLGLDDKLNLWLFPDCFVAFSDYQKTWAKKINPWTKIVKILHAVDLEKFNPQVKPTRLALEKPVILCVSGPEKFKKVDLVIRAVAQLENGSLLLIGRQPSEIIKLGERMLGKRFKQMTTSLEKMPQFYRAADLFTLVSEPREAFGLSFLEAMACNLPVVTRDDSLRREIIGNAGLFIKHPEDSQAYAQLLKKALEKNWQQKPRRQAEKFSWEKAAILYQKFFESLV